MISADDFRGSRMSGFWTPGVGGGGGRRVGDDLGAYDDVSEVEEGLFRTTNFVAGSGEYGRLLVVVVDSLGGMAAD